MNAHLNHALRPFVFATVAAAALTACGGGDDPPPTATFSGVAADATGRAMANAAIDVKCRAGAATATAGADGAYSVPVSSAQLPCSVRATAASVSLHALAITASGLTQTVNITPLTDLAVAHVAGGSATTFHDGFAASGADAGTDDAAAAAQAYLREVLEDAGMDPSGVADLVAGALVPATATSAGDAHGQLLTAYAAALQTAGTAHADLAKAVALASDAATEKSNEVTLAPAQLLSPAATNCAALRSGAYRVVSPRSVDPDWRSHIIKIDATTLTGTDQDGVQGTLTPTGACAYTTDGGGKLVLSAAGVGTIVANSDGEQPYSVNLVFPEQRHQVSEFAGDWNLLSFGRNDGASPFAFGAGTVSANATGAVTAQAECVALDACVADTGPFPTLVPNTGGGFSNGEGTVFYSYRAGGGQLMAVGLDGATGSLVILAKQRTLGLPAVGDVNSSWNISSGTSGWSGSSYSTSDWTITSVDAAAGSYMRQSGIDGHSETLTLNTPRNGLSHRAAGTATDSNGNTVQVNELYAMTPPGMGLSAYGRFTTSTLPGFFGFSVRK